MIVGGLERSTSGTQAGNVTEPPCLIYVCALSDYACVLSNSILVPTGPTGSGSVSLKICHLNERDIINRSMRKEGKRIKYQRSKGNVAEDIK
jgi:hypothetical protein